MLTLNQDEHVIYIARKHWFILFADALFLLLLFGIPFLLFYGFKMFDFGATFGIQIQPIANIGSLYYLFLAITFSWFLLLWIIFFVKWTDYYLDSLIITNQRIIDTEQLGLFSRDVSTVHWERIQDVTIKVHGAIATLLDFGDVLVQTAATEHEFIKKGIARPYAVKQVILQEIGRRHLLGKTSPSDLEQFNP